VQLDAPVHWALEREFWTGGAAFYEQHLAADCLMAFAPPAGVMTRDQIVQSIAQAPRWRQVTFTRQRLLSLSDTAVILVYNAAAQREGESSTYHATISSTYRRRNSTWELVFHQQSASPPA
jgi:hypothetical protein